jgi:hypothetical protein
LGGGRRWSGVTNRRVICLRLDVCANELRAESNGASRHLYGGHDALAGQVAHRRLAYAEQPGGFGGVHEGLNGRSFGRESMPVKGNDVGQNACFHVPII